MKQLLTWVLLACLAPGFFQIVPASAKAETDKGCECASASANIWLALVDARQYEDSWRTAAEIFQQAVTQHQWRQMAGAVREPLGPLVKRDLAREEYKTRMPGMPDGHYCVLQFHTRYRNKEQAMETVILVKENTGKWHVAGYFIK